MGSGSDGWLLFGLGVPEWLTIIGLVGGLWLTFWLMAKASVRYEQARLAREARAGAEPPEDAGGSDDQAHGKEHA